MDWQVVLGTLDGIERHLWDVGEGDHNPFEAFDLNDEPYCLGCAVGESAQRLRADIEDYIAARQQGD